MASATLPLDLHDRMLSDVDAAIDSLSFGERRRGEAVPRPARFHRILACVDVDPQSRRVLEWARYLGGLHDADVTLLTVDPPPQFTADWAWVSGWWGPLAEEYERASQRTRATVHLAAEELQAEQVHAEARIRAGPPVREIAEEARRIDADLVILGSHGGGPVSRAVFGSVANGVAHRVASSVLIARQPPPPSRLLLAVDGSLLSRRAAMTGLAIAAAEDAQATVLHVLAREVETEKVPRERFLDEAMKSLHLPEAPPNLRYELDLGKPGARIVARAEEDRADLVVLGASGLGSARGLALGSVSSHVVAGTRASVLMLKGDPG